MPDRLLDALEELGDADLTSGSEEPDVLLRPRWRGLTHQWAVFLVMPLAAALLVHARGANNKVACSIYVAGLLSMFGASALYHRGAHTKARRLLMRRLDHSAIYLAIAGTATPICLIGLSRPWGIPLLCVVWVGAFGGISLQGVDIRWARITSGALYIVLGWATIIGLPVLIMREGWLPALLILGGGVAYTVGAVMFAKGWPRLRPKVFGYHEVWHLWTITAAILHFFAVWTLS